MARPRIFISSTFFDLRQVRADLERFIKDMGYESVRNETGGIPYGKEHKPEDYCYKEISEIDILVGVVGGRFGSEAENKDYSITQTEIKTAIDQNKQVYIFVEKNVLAEYETYLINKESETIKYRFVDDKRVYKFIEEIYALPKNNIVHPFETAQDIISFLKEQWAGVFRDLLSRQTKKGEYDNVSQKVTELTEIAGTITTYLENVLKNVAKEKSEATDLISKEKERLENFHVQQSITDLDYVTHLQLNHRLTYEKIIEGLTNSKTITELRQFYQTLTKRPDGEPYTYHCIVKIDSLNDLNAARQILNLPEFDLSPDEIKQISLTPLNVTRRKKRPDDKK